MIKIAVLFPLVALLPLASAQLPASAPHCVATCLQAKINEAGSLAPGVQPTDVAGLCATSAFVEAYDNCLSENCSSDEADTGRLLRQKFCAAAATSATLTDSAASKVASASSSADSMASDAASEAEGTVFTTVASATSSASGTSNSTASRSDSISSSVASVTSSLASEVSSRAQALSSSHSSRVASVSAKASSLSSAASASGSAAAASASQGNGSGAFAVASPSIFTAFLSSVVLGALAVFA